MRSSLRPSHVIQTCLILSFAITSNATRFSDNQATPTAPPPAASLKARTPDYRDLTKPCGAFDNWVKADPGASCESISKDNGVTMQEFILMNPDVNPSCSNLVAGNTYCVGQMGANFAVRSLVRPICLIRESWVGFSFESRHFN
ncbi:hypothetical protein BDR22DRAFT_855202 [Usnea florida]